MSDDLTAELRAEADLCDQVWDAIGGFHPADPDMLRSAADEIARLRDAIQDLTFELREIPIGWDEHGPSSILAQ